MTRRVVLYIDSLKTGGAERVTLFSPAGCQTLGGRPRCSPAMVCREILSRSCGCAACCRAGRSAWLRKVGPLGFPFRVLVCIHGCSVTSQIWSGMTTLPAIKLLLAVRVWLALASCRSELPPLKKPGWPWRILRRMTYPWAQLHLVQTEATGEWLAQHLNALPQLCLANPVAWPLPRFAPDPDPAAWLASRDICSDHPVLLAVGTKAHQKGFDRLVAMSALLMQRHPTFIWWSLEWMRCLITVWISRLSCANCCLWPRRLHFPGRVECAGLVRAG